MFVKIALQDEIHICKDASSGVPLILRQQPSVEAQTQFPEVISGTFTDSGTGNGFDQI
jgi:hypothetical protein